MCRSSRESRAHHKRCRVCAVLTAPWSCGCISPWPACGQRWAAGEGMQGQASRSPVCRRGARAVPPGSHLWVRQHGRSNLQLH